MDRPRRPRAGSRPAPGAGQDPVRRAARPHVRRRGRGPRADRLGRGRASRHAHHRGDLPLRPRRTAGAAVRGTAALFLLLALAAGSSPLQGQPADPTAFASAADVRAAVRSMLRDMKPGQGFSWRPLVRGGSAVAALEIWKKPGKPAVHPGEAEYVVVVEGAGTMISGGTLVDAHETSSNLVEGSRIEGGTSRALHEGDVFFVPAGTPHWFGITGDRLVLLGTKLPQAVR